MVQDAVKFACPYCREEFDSLDDLKTHFETEHPSEAKFEPVWGREVYPTPTGSAFIDSDVMKCVGCGLCAEACSMRHYGVINKDFARIHVRKFLLPLPKAIIVTCSQCQDEERPCEEVCPLSPPAIYFDNETQHMVVNEDTCTACLLCKEACATEAIGFNPEASDKPLVCDLCDTDNSGKRDPQCVRICPATALYFHDQEERGRPLRDMSRRSSDEKADMVAKRLYPLTRESIAYPPWNKNSFEKGGKNG
ncbi:4Fe-4S dicluster domain-containing protein [Thermodesulfobacteriota bacterium]